jgi:hypothetical protein
LFFIGIHRAFSSIHVTQHPSTLTLTQSPRAVRRVDMPPGWHRNMGAADAATLIVSASSNALPSTWQPNARSCRMTRFCKPMRSVVICVNTRMFGVSITFLL